MTAELAVGLLALVGVVLAGVIAAACTLAVQLVRWNADNRKLWGWNRQLQDHIYRGSPPPPPAPPAGLFD